MAELALPAHRPTSVSFPCVILRRFRVQKIFQVQNSTAGAWGNIPSAGIHANAMLSFLPRAEHDTLFTPPSPLELFEELC